MVSTLAIETVPVDATNLEQLDAREIDCPKPLVFVEGTNSATCVLVRNDTDSDITTTLEERQNNRATVFYDNRNRIRLIFTWALNANLATIFKNSGYNLGKSIMSEAKRWLVNEYGDSDVRYYARLARWTGSIDQVSRNFNQGNGILQYATIAINIQLNNNPSQEIHWIRSVAGGLAAWVSQGGAGSTIVPVTDAWEAGSMKLKREDEPTRVEVARQASTNWCSAPIGGLFNAGSPHTPRKLYYDFEC
ncbi:hypothetical protein BS50DRAFT_675075 [Corynespora cassiicola Philippines]|uniref:Uncharacterized protein n=1 Tax=Corynespora cassiicola Philippines TaxID=1448308 RepID=A0A2T2NTI6_CORCC|nr:hypothetical protein BS50DRAFT_675075 [Corynespora cassiicola Philippines]